MHTTIVEVLFPAATVLTSLNFIVLLVDHIYHTIFAQILIEA